MVDAPYFPYPEAVPPEQVLDLFADTLAFVAETFLLPNRQHQNGQEFILSCHAAAGIARLLDSLTLGLREVASRMSGQLEAYDDWPYRVRQCSCARRLPRAG